MGKHSIFPSHIKNILEADAEDRQMHTKNTAKMYRYEARERVKQAFADIQWYAEKQPEKQCDQVFRIETVCELVKAILHAINQGSIPENTIPQKNGSYKMILHLLSVINRALGELLDPQMVQRLRQMNPEAFHRQYRNIAAWELMFILFR